MKMNDYKKIMDAFTPDEEMKERIKCRMEGNGDTPEKSLRKPYHPLRRALSAACLTLLVSMCMITATFAASPALRAAVLGFFHIKETEVLPEPEDGLTRPESGDGLTQPESGNGLTQPESGDGLTQPESEKEPTRPKSGEPDISISNAEIGGRVKAEYIRLDKNYGLQCGLLTQVEWNDDMTKIASARFWDHEDGTLKEADIDLHTTAFQAEWQDGSYKGTIYWFTHNGELGFYTGENPFITDEVERDWYVSAIPHRTDAVLLHLSAGRQSDYNEYVYLCHLTTGKIEDFLAGSGIEKTDNAYDYTFSEDLRYARVTYTDENKNPATLLIDIENKKQLGGYGQTGIAADVVTLTGDTLLLLSYKRDDEGIETHVSCHACDLNTGRTVQTLEETACYRWWEASPEGIISFESRYCIRVTKSGSTHVIDLTTGAETAIDNFTFEKGGKFSPSPSGKKFLYFTTDSDTSDFHISQLGVLDVENESFLAFDRENNLQLEEEGIGWDTENRVVLRAHTRDSGTGYIILYEF